MLTLVHAPRSRSSRFLWLLEEIGEPYDIQYVSIRRVDGSGALDPTNPHPHGKVPFLKDGASMVFEQTAIALYLGGYILLRPISGPAIGDPCARGVSYRTCLLFRRARAGIHVEVHESLFCAVAEQAGSISTRR